MRIFQNLVEAVSEVKRDLAEMGIRKSNKSMQNKNIQGDAEFDTLELVGYSYMIEGEFKDNAILGQVRTLFGLSTANYVEREVEERLSGASMNPGHAYKHRREVWEEFLDPRTQMFDYTYSERMRPKYFDAIQTLRDDLNSRQAVIQIYESVKDDVARGGRRRVPCSMHYQLLYSTDGLSLIYSMRSCDAFTHLAVDIACALMIRNAAARALQVKGGPFVHQFGSLHCYRKDAGDTF